MAETPVDQGAPMPDAAATSLGERTSIVTDREGAVTAREGTAMRREEAAGVREEAAGVREDAAGVREETAGLREETSALREEAVHAREEATRAKAQLEALLMQVREANERLVLASMQAQTMAENAERDNRLKDEFLATVSHELRTPLNAILGWAHMLAARQLPPERAELAIAIVERNAVALARIIEDLLDVSRIVAGTFHLVPQPVDLAAVARTALDAVRPVAAAKGVQLTLAADAADIEPISGDPARLQQVILNVIANAVKFTPEGGRVNVFVERSAAGMDVRVVDTGEGISPAFLPHMFERFRQADGATTRRQAGLGLGLAIARQILDMHGGSIEATSEGLGRGATFTIHLPVEVGAVSDSGDFLVDRRTSLATASPAPPSTRLDNLHVLVVDDTEDGRALTALVLTQAGARVTAVPSARDALDAIERERPDVMVSDIGMPDEDGYALIRAIRAREAASGRSLPAVALTGYARAADRDRILAAGFQAHVTKPLDPVDLTATIAAAAARTAISPDDV